MQEVPTCFDWEGTYLLDPKPMRVSSTLVVLPGLLVIHSNCSNRCAFEPAMVHSSFCRINFRWYGIGLPWSQRVTEKEPEKRLPHPRKAAGAQITQSRLGEVVTINNNTYSGPAIGMSTIQTP